jgi:preprotein translocase subunit SecD
MKTIIITFLISFITLSFAEEDHLEKAKLSSITLRVQERENDDGTKLPVTKEQVDLAARVIENRLQQMGVDSTRISSDGENRIIVKLPGVESEEAMRISAKFAKSYKFELREVHSRNYKTGPEGKILAQMVQDGETSEPGYRVYKIKHKDTDGKEFEVPILLNRRPALSNFDVANAMADPFRTDTLNITLNAAGTAKMKALTENMHSGQGQIAILLDGEVISAPIVQNPPLGKELLLSGIKEPSEVQSIAIALINPLQNPLRIEEVHSNALKK